MVSATGRDHPGSAERSGERGNINIDSELKKSAQELYSDLGLDLSTAVNLFLKQSLREQKIPFEIKRESEEEGFFDTLKSFTKRPEYSSFAEMVNSNTD
mgnify:CR=1 FL=1